MNFYNNRAGRLPMKIYDYGIETLFLCKTAMKVFSFETAAFSLMEEIMSQFML